MDDISIIPTLSIHPDRINVFNEIVRHVPKKYDKIQKIQMPKSNFHNNKFSNQARRKVSKALDYLIFLSSDKQLPPTAHGKSLNFKISFITLTLSSLQKHSDNEIKELLLNQFLIEAKRKWNVSNYVWRAEKQKNGNIHFHILTDRFIPWSELRQVWNRIQNKLGYCDRYREEMLKFHNGGFKVRADLLKHWSYKKQIKAYKEGCANDWHNPNSTDIHSIRLVSNVKAYVMKYVTKDQAEGEIIGRMWGCNYELTNLSGARVVVDSMICDEIRSAFRKIRPKFYKGEHFSVIYITPRQLCEAGAINAVKEFAAYLLEKFDFNFSLYTPG
jgi:hypothetical protein